MPRTRVVPGVVAAIALFLLAGCGDQDPYSVDGATSPTTSSTGNATAFPDPTSTTSTAPVTDPPPPVTLKVVLRVMTSENYTIAVNLWSPNSEEPNNHVTVSGNDAHTTATPSTGSYGWSVWRGGMDGEMVKKGNKAPYKIQGSQGTLTWTVQADGSISLDRESIEA